MATYDGNFVISPADGDNPGQGDDKIRELKAEIEKRMRNEHSTYVNAAFGTTGTQPKDWLHRAGSARAYYLSNAPTLRPDGVTSLGTNDKGRLWVSNGVGHAVKVWTGAAWSAATMPVKDWGGGPDVLYKYLTTGSWNMDATASLAVAHSCTVGNVRAFFAMVRQDTSDYWTPIEMAFSATPAGYAKISGGYVVLSRRTGGAYDKTTYNSTGFDRARVKLEYV